MSGLTCNTNGLVALVVDDEANVRMFARATLETIGFEVVEAKSGEEALERVGTLRPDVVLLDVMMPGISGYEVCAELRALHDYENLPILMMTGLDDLESINRAYEAGATDFLVKPLNWELMKHRVRYTIRSSIAFRSLANAQRMARTGSWETTVDGDLACSDETYRVLGLPRSEDLSLEALLANVAPEDREQVAAARRSAVDGGIAYEVEYAITDVDGDVRFIHERGQVTGTPSGRRVVGTVQDITERRRFEEQITFVAHHDSLTGLPNRRLFKKRLAEALGTAKRHERRVAVLYFDLDAFKRVNDTFGHNVGDRILKAVAARVRRCIRAEDLLVCGNNEATVSRLGGDEFTILLSEVAAPEDAAVVAERILERLARPYCLQDMTLRITPSIGITVYPDDGTTAETLLKNADMAMYQAKRAGRNNYQFFTPELQARAQNRIVLETELEHALDRDELHLHYQPIFDAEHGVVDEVEALIRWGNATLGNVEPGELIPVAEQTGLIVPIGEWLLRKACLQFLDWQSLPSPPARVSVNVSVMQLRHEEFAGRVETILKELDFSPRNLQIEITESVLMKDIDASERILGELQALGLTVAIDDFGTGYSSLSYLRRIRPDVLKIDRSFITDIDRDPKGGAIVRAIIAMAHELGVRVVAEGVETQGQLDLLRRARCDAIQGYLMARPGTAADIEPVLATPAASQGNPGNRTSGNRPSGERTSGKRASKDRPAA